MSRRNKIVHAAPVRAVIENLSHEGRGVTHVGDKVVFVDGALPGEDVSFRYVKCSRRYDEATVVEVHVPSAHRVAPRCRHFGVCGGCALQHLDPARQIEFKQQQLLEQLHHLGRVEPRELLAPLTGPHWGYRRKARLGVKYVRKKGKVLVGFRERSTPYLAELECCEVLHPNVGSRLTQLASLIGGLEAREEIAQIEVAVGDAVTALVFRHLKPLSAQDQATLREYAQAEDIHLYLQPGGPETAHCLWPEDSRLVYALSDHGVEMEFLPTDFTQVNADINRAMIPHALALLDPQPGDAVLDLFCGLGNFSLPIARRAREVVGVEGEAGLVQRARANAARNSIGNADFHVADLAQDVSHLPWLKQHYDKVLLDPPRSGAIEVLPQLVRLAPQRMVYVSCNPATLARDAGELVNTHGYRLRSAGVMDMFPHTAHVESIALFERD